MYKPSNVTQKVSSVLKASLKSAKAMLFEVCKQSEDGLAKDSENNAVYKKDEQESEENKNISVSERSIGTIQMYYEK